MAPSTLAAIAEGSLPKGDVLQVARLAGIQAAKRTAEWIPLAHPVPLDVVEVDADVAFFRKSGGKSGAWKRKGEAGKATSDRPGRRNPSRGAGV